jgi:hypothetical protein
MPTSSGTLALVGLGLEAFGGISKAFAIRDANRLNAQISENNAKLFEIESRIADKKLNIVKKVNRLEESRFRKEGKRFLSTQRAAIGKTGITSESFAGLVEETAFDLELDALAIRYVGSEKEGVARLKVTEAISKGLSEERKAALSRDKARQAGFNALLSGLGSGIGIIDELKQRGIIK